MRALSRTSKIASTPVLQSTEISYLSVRYQIFPMMLHKVFEEILRQNSFAINKVL